ncbi:MAG: leucyl aminopeptidase family protein [Actinobacteria bacterium]|nr:leucyl aminopeptidase family protein [Actinomycetota bacterium]
MSLPAHFPALKAIPADLKSALSSEIIALGFVEVENADASAEKEFKLVGSTLLLKSIAETFGIDLIDELKFFTPSGKAGESFELPISAPDAKSDRLLLVGLGDQSIAALRAAGATIGRKVKGKSQSIATFCATTDSHVTAHAISATMGAYLWNLKSGPKPLKPTIYLSISTLALKRALAVSAAVWRARDLVHTPANIKTPAWVAANAKLVAKERNISIKILAGKELAQFGGLSAVGNSSRKSPPRFIEITYAPKGSSNWPHVVLVGKGITFDTGGYSLKRPYDIMMAMKTDMAGAAAVLCVVSALPELAPRVRVTALLMCAENAVSGTAQRPSDVITHFGGTTTEVLDTDAEGRLVLADGLAYADLKLKPDYLIDIATLTGAATLSLGKQYAAMYSRDDKLAATFYELGDKSGDRVWRMPLVDEYTDCLESEIADQKNIGGKSGYGAGSVTAALFLEKFVGNRKWVHFDIAGTGRSEVDAGENPKGGTGFGVRLLTTWISSL